MFFLDHAWLVPLIPAVSFVVILLFGKRMPRQGSEVGIAAVGASFVLVVRRARPVDQPRPRRRGRARVGGASARSAAASAGSAPRARAAQVMPVVHHVTWFQNGGVQARPSASRSTGSR